MTNVLVVGAGPAGVAAALRAADLGARTALVAGAESAAWPPTTAPYPSVPWPMLEGCCAMLGNSVGMASLSASQF